MIPTCISEDREAAARVLRRVLRSYVALPNYQNYWIEAGYEEEMQEIRALLARGEADRVVEAMSDRWLRDCTLYGTASEVREGVEAWIDAGVRTPILVPSSTSGGQFQAIAEVLDAFS
jgi:alkanesulfonate monooxygenase SsuD/methylene tetrahydromethanopterin reductase-like flavin-dependent oxidoreductase (luciferase family)